MTDVARLAVVFSADTSALDKGFARAKKQVADFQKVAGKESVKLDADSSGLTKSLDASTKSLGAFHKEAKKKVDVDVDKNGVAAAHLKELSGGFGELSSNIRQFNTIATATTAIPAVIAGIGALPAIATAAAGAVGQLSIALGQGLAGAAAIGGTALAGSTVGLKAYSAILSRTVSDSRAAYEATHQNAVAQNEHLRQILLNTKASADFNQELNEMALALTIVEAEIGNRVFPTLTKLLDLWAHRIPALTPPLYRLMEGVTNVGAAFGTALSKGRMFSQLQNILDFVADSGITAANVLADIGRIGLTAIQPLLPAASRLQEHISNLTLATSHWVNSSQGMKTIGGIVDTLEHRFYQLRNTVRDFGLGLAGVFIALDQQGGPDRLMKGLENLAAGFRKVMSRTGEGRKAIVDFMDSAQPTLNQLWKLTKTVVTQFGLLASNVVKAGQSGDKMGTLASAIKGVRESVAPLRRLFQDTFIALGPILADLIPEATKFLAVFLGSSGPLKTFLTSVTGLLRVFNRLPDGIKSTAANLLAMKVILGTMGVGAVVGPLGNFAANMFLVNTAAAKLSGKSGLAAVGTGLKSIGLILAGGIGLAAIAGAFYLAYKNSDKFHDAVNKLAKDLSSWGKDKFKDAKQAVRDIFDWDTEQKTKVSNFAVKNAHQFATKYAETVRKEANNQDDEGSAGFEFGMKVGTGIGKGINAWSKSEGGDKGGGAGLSANFLLNLMTPVGMGAAIAKWVGRTFGGGFTKGITSEIKWGPLKEKLGQKLHQLLTFNNLGAKIFDAIPKSWKNIDIKYEGSALQKLMKKIRGDSDKTKREATKDAWDLKRQSLKAYASQAAEAIPIWGKLLKLILDKTGDAKKDGTKNAWDLKRQSLKAYSSQAAEAIPIWGKLFKLILDKTGSAEKDGTKNAWDLKRQSLKAYAAQAAEAVPIYGKLLQLILDKTGKAETEGTKNAWDLKRGSVNAWQSILEATPVWGTIASKIIDPSENAESKTVGAWGRIIGFINKVLSAVKLPTIKLDSGNGGSSEPTSGTKNNNNSGGFNRPGAARGGLTSGTHADAWRSFPVTQMARGGAQRPEGGVAKDGPRVVYGEAGPESYVTLGRYTAESAKALMVANETWAKKGWMDRIPHDKGGPHAPGRRMADGGLIYMASGGAWYPKTAAVNAEVERRWGVSGSTYPGHGADGDAMNSVDWMTGQGWGVAATGPYLAKGNAIVDYLLSAQKAFTDYIIWQKKIWDSGGQSTYKGGGGYGAPTTVSGFHQDHVHWESLENNPGPTVMGGGTGGVIASLWDTVGNALWNRLVQPAVDSLANSLSGGSLGLIGDIGGALTKQTADKIKGYIIGESGSSGGSYSGGGSLDAWLKGGLELGGAFPATSSNIATLRSLAMEESSGNPNAVNDLPGTTDDPSGLLQVKPSTFKQYMVSGHGNIFDPEDNTAASTRYQKAQYGALQAHAPYARGGIAGKGLKVDMPSPIKQAFLKVADTLASFAGYGPGVAVGDRGGVGTGKHLVGITNEAGPEAIVPLGRKTPEGMHALRTANKAHGIRAYATGGLTFNGPLASQAIGIGRSFWGPSGASFGYGPGWTVRVRSGMGAARTGNGVIGVDPQWVGSDLFDEILGHEIGHAGGLPHAGPPEALMTNPVFRGDRPIASELSTFARNVGVTGGRTSGGGTTGGTGGGGSTGSGGGFTSGNANSNSIHMSGGGSASTFSRQGGSVSRGSVGSGNAEMLRNSLRGANANEDAAKTLRRVERILAHLPQGIREGVNHNMKHGLETGRSMDASDINRMSRKLLGGAPIARKR